MSRNPHQTRIPTKAGVQREISMIGVRQKPREALKISQGRLVPFGPVAASSVAVGQRWESISTSPAPPFPGERSTPAQLQSWDATKHHVRYARPVIDPP